MKPRLCVVVTAETASALMERLRLASKSVADMVEIRFDWLKEPVDLSLLRRICRKPLIATNRPSWEGGCFEDGEGERIDVLLLAATMGFNIVDIELKTRNAKDVIQKIRRLGAQTIVSFHDFNRTPPLVTLERILRAQVKLGGEVCKIVTTAKNVQDNLTLLTFMQRFHNRKLIAFGMGRYGVLSRIAAPLVGSYCTYAALDNESRVAPGQLTLEDMIKIYELIGVGAWKSQAVQPSTA